MTLFLTRAFFNEFSLWVLLTPLIFSPLLLLSFSGELFTLIFFMCMCACALVFSKYHEVKQQYALVLQIAPIPTNAVRQVNLLFLSSIAGYYIIFSLIAGTFVYALFRKTLLFPSLHELAFLIGSCIILIAVNSWQLKLYKTYTLLILNFLFVFAFTSFHVPKLAADFGYIVLSFALLLLAITLLTYRRV